MILLLFLVVNSYSQTEVKKNGYSIVGLTDASKLDYYVGIVNKIDFEQYRLRSEQVTIKFRNGFSVELASAESLALTNSSVMPTNYVIKHSDGFLLPEFKIMDDGTLVTLHRTKKTKSEIKYNSVK